MEDISKRTVTLLLIVAIALTAVFTWKILGSSQTIIVQQQPLQQPESTGTVSVGIFPPGTLGVSEDGGNLRIRISRGG